MRPMGLAPAAALATVAWMSAASAGEAVADEEKTGGFGIRAGVVLPSPGESQDYGANAILGVSYRIGRHGSSTGSTGSTGPRPRVAYEIGLDIGMSEEAGGYSSVPVRARFDALFGSGSVYLLAGGAGAIEFVTDTLTDKRYTNYAGALDLGAGLLFAGGKADVRLAYEVLLGSDNLGGQTVVSFGYRF